jgi:serine phosphatase RsbU (regulator of sigma subunit)
MARRSTLAPENPVRAYPVEPFQGRFNLFYAAQRLGCHKQQKVLLSGFEGRDAARPNLRTYFLVQKGMRFALSPDGNSPHRPVPMEIQIAVAKINKYAVSESGDTLEVVERPNGGLSVVLADGQSSGRGAKAVSMMVVRKVIGLLAEGVRDGAAARAASDALYTEKAGKVSSTLNIASLDMDSNSIVLTRNNPSPVLIARGIEVNMLEGESEPIGNHRRSRPLINEIPIESDLTVVFFTDGLVHAGERRGTPMDTRAILSDLLLKKDPSAQFLADALLESAIHLDERRPADDCSVVVLKVLPRTGDDVRRLNLRLPIDLGRM